MFAYFMMVACLGAVPNPENGDLPVEKGPKYCGMCDASAAASIGKLGFIVANDEDNVLRVYRRDEGGKPTAKLDLNDFLGVDPKSPETDIEGATWLNKKIYWITSHGCNKDGEMRTSRHRIFATEFVKEDGRTKIQPVGKPYRYLIVDLMNAPQLAAYNLAEAASKAPKAENGFNIEGLAYTPEGHLLIGLRNPIPLGKALVIPLLNPEEVIQGERAKIGDAFELNLGFHGVRSIEYVEKLKKYLIVAGPPNNATRTIYRGKGNIALYLWSGKRGSPPREINVDFGKKTPEAFVVYPGTEGKLPVHFFSDDGTHKIGGKPCKELKSGKKRCFRTQFWFGLHKFKQP